MPGLFVISFAIRRNHKEGMCIIGIWIVTWLLKFTDSTKGCKYTKGGIQCPPKSRLYSALTLRMLEMYFFVMLPMLPPLGVIPGRAIPRDDYTAGVF